jgi:hypothetical protein
MNHDQLFKELLREFLPEFMALFFPDIAARLDFTRVEFLDKENFTDFPDGAVREADVVAQVYTRDGDPEILLIHIEVESRRRGIFGERFWEYYSLLRIRHRRKVIPVVLYLSPGSGGLTMERYADSLFGQTYLTFDYHVVGLPDLSADTYANQGELATALSAVMRPATIGRLEQKWQALVEIARSALNDARKLMLANVVESYLILNESENAEIARRTSEQEEVTTMISVYEERGIKIGIERGIAQGVLRGQRDALLRQMRAKFGELPLEVSAKVEDITDTAVLEELLVRVLTANSLEEMGLPA